MRIGIIGTGNIGGTLGRRWSARGHQVGYGTREPDAERVQALLAASPGSRAASPAAATAGAEVVVLATPWEAARSALASAGDLRGTILVDCTNPIGPGLTHAATPSGAELIAGWAPGARVVKAFNSVGFNVLEQPSFGERSADAFLCGDDPAAKEVVAELATELGLTPVDCGPLAKAALLESLALLWISLTQRGLGREIAFSLLRR